MRTKHVSGVLLSILLVTSLIALPSFIITITTQTVSANPSENFTIVALPDTQYYSQSYPGRFENQTEWIVQKENEKNIVFVTHLGDIVNTYNVDSQWKNADNAMSILDNKVPYGILPGNHDQAGNGSAPYYENYFPASRYENYPYWGGSYDSTSVTSSSPNMNNYQLFSAGGMNFIALSLQYNPPPNVLSWADNVLNNYSDRRAIISTHSYLNLDGSLTGNGGTTIYNDVVRSENNVFLVLCGHMYDSSGVGEYERIDNFNNRIVYQLLSDYQGLDGNGDGYLRIMEFVPSENKIYVKTYSPYLNQYRTGSSSQFELSYPMTAAGGVSVLIGPRSQSGLNGDNLRYTITVYNNRNVSDNYILTDNDNAGWSPSVSPTSLVVPAFGSGSATLSVTVPSGAIGGTIDNILVKATENDNAAVFDNASCLAQVTIVRGFSVSISPSSKSGANGENLTYTVTVNNIGIVDDNYSLSVTDNENWSPSVLPTSLSVSAGSSGNATLSVILGIGTDTITLHATNDNTTGEATCTARGLPISVSLTPSSQYGWHGENLAYTAVVKNLENTADNFILTLTDTQPWQASWNAPNEVSTPPVYYSTNIKVYQDSYVMAGSSAGTNYGSRYNMYVGIYQSNLEYTYTQWNLSSIPANATIDNAYVYMTGQFGPSHGSYVPDNMWVEAWNVNNDTWNENVITWNNKPGYGPTLLENKHWIAYTWAGYYAWVSWNVTSWVQNQFENGKLVSFAFKSNGVGDNATGNSGWFQTKDSTGVPWDPQYIPYMTVSYHVPSASLSLEPGENWTGTVWVITGASGIDSKTVTATSMTDNTITTSATAQAIANVTSVSETISPQVITSTPGTYHTFTVTVTNLGNLPDNFSLAAIDTENWQPTVPSTLGPIAAGGSDNATLSVTIPSGAVGGTIDSITVTATSQSDNTAGDSASCIIQVTVMTGAATIHLENLYKVGLEKDLQLLAGRKLVVKFYKYDNITFQAGSVVDNNITPPENIKENENAPQPRAAERFSWGTVQIARLVLTTENENEVISTIASFTVHQSDLRARYMTILGAWSANPGQQSAFRAEVMDILSQWSGAPL